MINGSIIFHDNSTKNAELFAAIFLLNSINLISYNLYLFSLILNKLIRIIYMRTIYLRKENGNNIRKVLLDMPYLVTHKIIRLPKYYFEDGLYILNKLKNSNNPGKYYLTEDKVIKEDENFYYFKFPFKTEEVENYAD